MKFRLKEHHHVHGVEWLTHGNVYEGDWTPGRPKYPRHVRLISPDGKRCFDISIQALTEVRVPWMLP